MKSINKIQVIKCYLMKLIYFPFINYALVILNESVLMS